MHGYPGRKSNNPNQLNTLRRISVQFRFWYPQSLNHALASVAVMALTARFKGVVKEAAFGLGGRGGVS